MKQGAKRKGKNTVQDAIREAAKNAQKEAAKTAEKPEAQVGAKAEAAAKAEEEVKAAEVEAKSKAEKVKADKEAKEAAEKAKVEEEAKAEAKAKAEAEAKAKAEKEAKAAAAKAEAEAKAKAEVEKAAKVKAEAKAKAEKEVKAKAKAEAEAKAKAEKEAAAAAEQTKRQEELEEQEYQRRFAKHRDELKWLYTELYQNDWMFEELCGQMHRFYTERRKGLKTLDREREANPDWYKKNDMMGMMLYVDNFAGNLKGVESKLDYLEESGVNYVHLMPVMPFPTSARYSRNLARWTILRI